MILHKMTRKHQSGPYTSLCGKGNGSKALARNWSRVTCKTCRKVYASTLKKTTTQKESTT